VRALQPAAAGLVIAIAFSSRPVAMRESQTGATPQPASERCRVDGRVTSGAVPLPGVSIGIRAGDATRAATSTEVDGRYSLLFTPNATYHLVADFTGFTSVTRDLTLGAPPCQQTVDFDLALNRSSAVQPSGVPTTTAGQTSAVQATSPTGTAPAGRGALPQTRTATAGATPAAGAAAGTTGRGGQRFQTLAVQGDANATTEPDAAAPPDERELAALVPPGFAAESAQADAIAVNGSTSATNLNRGLLNERLQAIAAGQFDPASGQFAPGFGPIDGAGAFAGGPDGGFGGRGGPGGRGGGPGGPGGRGGPGGFVLGGRGARGQNAYQGSTTYTFGGSALSSPPYQLRPDVPVTQPQYAQNTFGATFGGPLKIPGLYADTNRRTNFQINYTGNESNNLFDQYATVPTDAMRQGDFSASPIQLIDPRTGQAFAGNQIPSNRVDPSAAALLSFIPAPNLPGTTRNFHISTPAHTSSEAISVRLTQNLSPTPPQNGRGGARGRGAAGGGGGGGGGRFGGGGGRGGPFNNGRTNIVLNAQVQYRENKTEALNVFPDLGGETTNKTLTVPLSLNIVRGRTIQNIGVNVTHSSVETTNNFANTDNVAALAGIQFPNAASIDPLNWGVPNLSFSGFTGVRGASASQRSDDRLSASYMWLRPFGGTHRTRLGGDVRIDRSDYQTNANARGSFTFTGRYTGGGAATTAATGADFADFLLGLPQQASLQVGGTSQLRQRGFDLFVEDNWQKSAKLTFNLGLRYELARPYVELNGRMANLDATTTLSEIAPVLPGAVGPFTGTFPTGLLNTDANNLGPRLGVAYRLRPTTILRGGYSITYNSGSYASIARQLAGQPPFADTETIAATSNSPLTLADALLSSSSTTTNNWGVDRDYALGMIQTWNATVTHNLTQDWMLQAGYTGIKGTDLDILRAPALGAGGVLIPGVEAFIWESSGGRSLMNAGNVQVRRRLANGYSGALSYTYAHAMDNASSLGAGGPIVAQNDNDLGAEWGRSSFERRQQLSGTLYVELPWGPNRRWLKDGGTLAAIFGEWSAQFSLTLQSGPPLTARVLGAASDLLRGVNGSLRANLTGASIPLSNPTVDEFFDTTAFAAPAPGTFGDSPRNAIIGPGTRQLNGLFQRDVRIGGSRSVTLQVNALNLLNAVQWAAVDTNFNSPTFGQVLSARPMRAITVTARLRF
jgi:hypothetical protein